MITSQETALEFVLLHINNRWHHIDFRAKVSMMYSLTHQHWSCFYMCQIFSSSFSTIVLTLFIQENVGMEMFQLCINAFYCNVPKNREQMNWFGGSFCHWCCSASVCYIFIMLSPARHHKALFIETDNLILVNLPSLYDADSFCWISYFFYQKIVALLYSFLNRPLCICEIWVYLIFPIIL